MATAAADDDTGIRPRAAGGERRGAQSDNDVKSVAEVLSTILQNASAFPPPILNGISQAGGGTLYDLNGFPVYYEVAMDKVQYDYIHDHQLYNAYRQAVFARPM